MFGRTTVLSGPLLWEPFARLPIMLKNQPVPQDASHNAANIRLRRGASDWMLFLVTSSIKSADVPMACITPFDANVLKIYEVDLVKVKDRLVMLLKTKKSFSCDWSWAIFAKTVQPVVENPGGYCWFQWGRTQFWSSDAFTMIEKQFAVDRHRKFRSWSLQKGLLQILLSMNTSYIKSQRQKATKGSGDGNCLCTRLVRLLWGFPAHIM